MHNVAAIMTDYGAWVDDEQYRERYLRPFDKKWNGRLEQFLESRLEEHTKP
jgi:hypothetical protein